MSDSIFIEQDDSFKKTSVDVDIESLYDSISTISPFEKEQCDDVDYVLSLLSHTAVQFDDQDDTLESMKKKLNLK